ncbi:uncharacterized protein LOC111309689 [Durio zibethinus]|uniref:Uncharacterized protein LOC111309689 n=1 Tax=Durio zibethinus TaxID=66656 RepID=A0A6P6AI06_DURZI|nr:uncharacterized protein LOC111309689 [Durio zibethinus]
MATSQKTQKMNITAVVFFLFIFTSNSFSSARLLNGFLSNGLAATEPTLNLELPVEDFDKSGQDPKPQVLPCDHMVPIRSSHVGLVRSPRLAGKYGPMILSMLPKGPVPSSGPSKGTNDVRN